MTTIPKQPDLILNGVPVGADRIHALPVAPYDHRMKEPPPLPEAYSKRLACDRLLGADRCHWEDNGRDEVLVVTDDGSSYLLAGDALDLSGLQRGNLKATLGGRDVVHLRVIDDENRGNKASRLVRATWSAITNLFR